MLNKETLKKEFLKQFEEGDKLSYDYVVNFNSNLCGLSFWLVLWGLPGDDMNDLNVMVLTNGKASEESVAFEIFEVMDHEHKYSFDEIYEMFNRFEEKAIKIMKKYNLRKTNEE